MTFVLHRASLSPLLANVMLDDLDKELEKRELRFARYADDFLIFVRSRSAAQRVLRTVGQFIESKLALVINGTKSKAARLGECTFLGFTLDPFFAAVCGCATGNSGSGRGPEGGIYWPLASRKMMSNWPREAGRDTGGWLATVSFSAP